MNWISVFDKLPPEDLLVLVKYYTPIESENNYEIARYYYGEDLWIRNFDDENITDEITHWCYISFP